VSSNKKGISGLFQSPSSKRSIITTDKKGDSTFEDDIAIAIKQSHTKHIVESNDIELVNQSSRRSSRKEEMVKSSRKKSKDKKSKSSSKKKTELKSQVKKNDAEEYTF